MPEPITFDYGFQHSSARGLNRGFLDSPGESLRALGQGVELGGYKLGYDAFAFGVDVGNAVDPIDRETDLDVGDNFWEVYSALNDKINYHEMDTFSPATKGWAEVTALAASTQAMAAKVSQWGQGLKFIQNTAHWQKTQAAGFNFLGGFGADIIHTRKDDPSLFALLPEEYQGDFAKWMINRDDDSEFEGRFKNAIEGGLFGVALEGTSHAIMSMFRSTKQMAHRIANGNPEKLREILEEVSSNGSGEFTEAALKNNSVIADTVNFDTKNWIFEKNSGTRMSVEDYMSAKARLTRRLAILDGSKKARIQKKFNKLNDELHELEDGLFKPVETLVDNSPVYVRNAPEARMVEGAYSTRQLAEDLPARDMIRSTVDEAEVLNHVSTKDFFREVSNDHKDFLVKVLNDVTESKENKELAEKLLKSTRLNPETSGDAIIDGAVELAGVIGKNSKVEVPRGLTTGEFIFKAVKNTYEGKLLDEAVPGLSENANLTQMIAYLSRMTGETVPQLYTTLRLKRNEAASKSLEAITKSLAKKKMSPTDIREVMEAIIAFDKLDAYTAGNIGSVARLLKAQQVNPNEMGKYASDHLRQTLKKISGKAQDTDVDLKEITARAEQTAKLEKTADRLLKSDTKEDEVRSFLKLYKEAIEESNDKKIKELVEGPTFGKLLSSQIVGGMLSNPKTLLTSVIGANAVSTLFKSIIVPQIEGTISSLARTIKPSANLGGSYMDGLIATKVLTKQMGNFISNIFAGANRKKLDELFHLSYKSTREGTEGAAKGLNEVKLEYQNLIRRYDEEGAWAKKTLAELAAPIMARTQALVNVTGRGIVAADTFYRGLNNEIQLALEAERTWYREGGRDIFKGVVKKKEFVDNYMKFMQDYAAIHRSNLTPELKLAETQKLFSGNRNLEDAVVASLDKAELIGRQATLQQNPEGLMAKVVQTIDKEASKTSTGSIALSLTFPFRKTPINMFNEILDHSLGSLIARRNLAALLKGTSEEKVAVLAKMTSGALAMGAVGTLIGIDRITGSFEPNERQQNEALGKKEHSVLIGDTWYSYRKLGPVAVFLSAMADAKNLSLDDPDKPYTMLLWQLMALSADESHLRTLNELLDLAQVEDPDKFKKYMIRLTANGLQPAKGITDFSADTLELLIKGENPKYRSTVEKEVGNGYQNFKALTADALKNNKAFRWTSEALGLAQYKVDLDLTGSRLVKHGNDTSSKILSLLGIDTMDNNKSPGVQELFERGLLSQSFSGHTVKGNVTPVTITPNQYKELQNRLFNSNINLRAELDNIVRSPEYNSLPETQRKQYLERVLNTNSELLKRMLYESDEKLQLQDYKNSLQDEFFRTNIITPDIDSPDYWEHVRRNHKYVRSNNEAVKEELFKEKLNENPQVDEKKLKDVRKSLSELGIGE